MVTQSQVLETEHHAHHTRTHTLAENTPTVGTRVTNRSPVTWQPGPGPQLETDAGVRGNWCSPRPPPERWIRAQGAKGQAPKTSEAKDSPGGPHRTPEPLTGLCSPRDRAQPPGRARPGVLVCSRASRISSPRPRPVFTRPRPAPHVPRRNQTPALPFCKRGLTPLLREGWTLQRGRHRQ